MENQELFFYQIRVGSTTRRGTLNEVHSFICKTNQKNLNFVRNHFQQKYSGLSVNVSHIQDVNFEIIQDESNGYSGKTERERELEKEIDKLKKTKRENVFISKVSKRHYSDEVIKLIGQMDKLDTELREKRKSTESLIEKILLGMYKPYVEYVRFHNELSCHINDDFEFELHLKGNIINEILK